METKLKSQYWGVFAEIQARKDLRVEEMKSTYEGPFAVLADRNFAEIADVDNYLELAQQQGGAVLELGCGSGRVLLPLAERGLDVTGVECSADMLTILRQRLWAVPAPVQKRVKLVQADILQLNLDGRFSLVTMPCCTLALFLTREDRFAILRKARQHLAPGGLFAFSYSLFDWDALARIDGVITRTAFAYEGTVARVRSGLQVLRQSGCILGNAYIEIKQPTGTERRCLASQCVMSLNPESLRALLEEAELVVLQEKRASLPGGLGERVTMICTHRPRGDYPLCHPYQPLGQPCADRLMLAEGEGCRVRDQHGTSYIDACAGLWNVQCGFGHPTIVAAVAEQLKRLSYGSLFGQRTNEPALALTRTLVSLAPTSLPWVYLTCSGSESIEFAIKLARLYHRLRNQPQKKEIVFLDQSYHGTYFGSMSVSGLYEDKEEFSPLLPAVSSISTPDTERCPPGMTQAAFARACADELEQRVAATQGGVAAFLAEPVLGSAGMIVPPKEYFGRIQGICARQGVLFLVDEVATGFGRTGHWFASEFFGLQPDMLLLAKGINSGYLPLGAVLFSAAIGQALLHRGVDTGHGSSHNGNPACAAAALAAIDVMRREALVQRAADRGAYFQSRLQELTRYAPVKTVRGLGLMLAIVLQQANGAPATPSQVLVLKTCLQRRRVLCYPGPASLAFLPPLVISRGEIDTIMNALHQVFRAVRVCDGLIKPA
jgi:adenosylmethionine-8-amino-7-oxononanoate aminotransferase/SAM-dependent methyltransferase